MSRKQLVDATNDAILIHRSEKGEVSLLSKTPIKVTDVAICNAKKTYQKLYDIFKSLTFEDFCAIFFFLSSIPNDILKQAFESLANPLKKNHCARHQTHSYSCKKCLESFVVALRALYIGVHEHYIDHIHYIFPKRVDPTFHYLLSINFPIDITFGHWGKLKKRKAAEVLSQVEENAAERKKEEEAKLAEEKRIQDEELQQKLKEQQLEKEVQERKRWRKRYYQKNGRRFVETEDPDQTAKRQRLAENPVTMEALVTSPRVEMDKAMWWQNDTQKHDIIVIDSDSDSSGDDDIIIIE